MCEVLGFSLLSLGKKYIFFKVRFKSSRLRQKASDEALSSSDTFFKHQNCNQFSLRLYCSSEISSATVEVRGMNSKFETI